MDDIRVVRMGTKMQVKLTKPDVNVLNRAWKLFEVIQKHGEGRVANGAMMCFTGLVPILELYDPQEQSDAENQEEKDQEKEPSDGAEEGRQEGAKRWKLNDC